VSILSDDYIIVNGISSDEVGIYIDTPPVPPMAQQRYTTYEVSMDEDRTSPDDTFEDMSLRITFFTFYNEEDFNNNDIYAYFVGAETLQFSRYSGYYFKVRQFRLNTPTVDYNGKRVKYTVDFTVAPFKYSTDNEQISVASGDIITNSGTRYSRPIYYITANVKGFTFYVNGESFYVPNASTDGEIVVDCERMIVYQNNEMIFETVGKFPFLAVGENQITYDDDISISVKKNERWY